jgi:polynucleotide 5'-hydroxyl-kinase GRC3/NOL9
MKIVPEIFWEERLEELRSSKGTALIIGTTDSGKSTLARFLTETLVSDGITVSFVDADIGQSSLGLPGTISAKAFIEKKDIFTFSFESMSFIGTVNPATNISQIIQTTKRMVNNNSKKAEVTLIDTTGLVSGDRGRLLKLGKIDAINPDHTIALQRSDELEHILEHAHTSRIQRIKVSRMVKKRTYDERYRYREEKFDQYFEASHISEFILYFHEAKFMYANKLIHPKDQVFSPGTVIGLNRDGDTRALGIISDVDENSINFRAPIESLKNINEVILGDIIFNN